MRLAPISMSASKALFNHQEFQDTNTVVTVKKNTATLNCHGKDLAKLTFDPANKMERPKLLVKNDGVFTAVFLNRINAILYRAGHETLYRKDFSWLFETSQTPFGSGTSWKEIKL